MDKLALAAAFSASAFAGAASANAGTGRAGNTVTLRRADGGVMKLHCPDPSTIMIKAAVQRAVSEDRDVRSGLPDAFHLFPAHFPS